MTGHSSPTEALSWAPVFRLRQERAVAALRRLEQVAVGRRLAVTKAARRLASGVPMDFVFAAYTVDLWAIEDQWKHPGSPAQGDT